jgi:hypothetical protein
MTRAIRYTLVAIALSASMAHAQASGGAPAADGGLMAGQSLNPGDAVFSYSGQFVLLYQDDGNLVLYRQDGTPLWWAGTNTTNPGQVAMQGDGNVVVYDGNGNAQWSTGTGYSAGAWLAVQDDGNLVVYDANGNPLWWTGTNR